MLSAPEAVVVGSMHFKNAQLYACSVLLYLPAVYLSLLAPAKGGPSALLFAGWAPFTMVLVAHLSLHGLAISWLLRLAGNVEKLPTASLRHAAPP